MPFTAPTPSHLTKLIGVMKDQKVKVILSVPWSDQKIAERVAQETGAKVVPMASGVGAVKGAENYLAAVDFNVNTLVKALRQ